MNHNNLYRRFLLLIAIVITSVVPSFAQPQLPDIVGAYQDGLNILSWTNQYDGIKSISVQRSTDSTYNYANIGYVKSLTKGAQAYIDGHPNPGKNWYRLLIVFNSDLTWISNRVKIMVDSADLVKKRVVISSDSLQKLASKVKYSETEAPTQVPPTTKTDNNSTTKPTNTSVPTPPKPLPPPKPVITLTIPDASTVDPYAYIKSEYVFVNPFTSHVNVEIKDYAKHMYSLAFFDGNNKFAFEVLRISEPVVIIDKRNFQKKGKYTFELYKDKQKFEKGYITIY